MGDEKWACCGEMFIVHGLAETQHDVVILWGDFNSSPQFIDYHRDAFQKTTYFKLYQCKLCPMLSVHCIKNLIKMPSSNL